MGAPVDNVTFTGSDVTLAAPASRTLPAARNSFGARNNNKMKFSSMKQSVNIIVILLQYIVENIYSLLGHSMARNGRMTHIRAVDGKSTEKKPGELE